MIKDLASAPANSRPAPALFALSCHSDEAAGGLSADTREQVQQGHASIADLTELLPAEVLPQLQNVNAADYRVASTRLGFGTHPESRGTRLWARLRRCVGSLRQRLIGYRSTPGFISNASPKLRACSDAELSADSLLHRYSP